jgi:RNA polymerase sigma-70 factor (ECF subfamily)
MQQPGRDGHHSAAGARQEQPTSLSLLERARAHDPEAWQRLLDLYRPLVLNWCALGGVNATDAEDVAQEVFTAAAAALDRFHRDRAGDTFRGWLRVITRNQILLQFRRDRRRPQAVGGSGAWEHIQNVADPFAEMTPGEETAELGQLYLRALELIRGEFEERTWQAFWRTVVDGRSPGDLTDELNMSANNIRQAKSRVLRRLRAEVGDLLD